MQYPTALEIYWTLALIELVQVELLADFNECHIFSKGCNWCRAQVFTSSSLPLVGPRTYPTHWQTGRKFLGRPQFRGNYRNII